MPKNRDPRQDPRTGDQLRDESGRLMTVDGVHSTRTNPKARQVTYTVGERDSGNVCGLSNWRSYYRRAEVIHTSIDPAAKDSLHDRGSESGGSGD